MFEHSRETLMFMSWLRHCLMGMVGAVTVCGGSLLADEAFVKDWLAKPILAPELPQMEVERFCDARIPRMPAVSSREEWEKHANRLREDMLNKVVLQGEAAKWKELPTHVVWSDVIDGGEGYRIKKLRYEAVPGLWIPALLYEPLKLEGKVAVAMNVNGHDPKGKATEYKQIRSINQAKRGMLVLNVEWLGMGQLRGDGFLHYRMNQLDLCGTSGLAPFYLSMKRGLDVLLAHPNADTSRVAVSGLSGGGWQTIFISSLDTRVTLSNPVAGYSSFITRVHNHSDLGDSEQTPNDMATVADYSHLTAMLAPRPALLTYNVKDDCCFASDHALPPLIESAKPIYGLFGKEGNLRSHVNSDPGTHNFERDNREAHYRMLVDFFLKDQAGVFSSATEIESQAEVKTAEQLNVDLPADNADFHKLALRLVESLPHAAAAPSDSSKLDAWRGQQRDVLKSLARARDYDVKAESISTEEKDGVKATLWKLSLSETWTVPAVEFAPPSAKSTTIVVADAGRSAVTGQVNELLKKGERVIAMDPFYIGESKLKSRPFLFALFVAAVGDRAMGLQSSQETAVVRWVKSQRPDQPVKLVAQGERLCVSALVAAALEPKLDAIELRESLDSLKDVVQKNYSVDQKPELFCFGLLEKFDLEQISALVAPRTVNIEKASK